MLPIPSETPSGELSVLGTLPFFWLGWGVGTIAIAALRFLLATIPAGHDFVVGLTYAQYLDLFNQVCATFAAAGIFFKPHSPRAGAATQGRLDGLSDTELRVRGRWASARTLRIYLDVATALAAPTMRAAGPFSFLLQNPRLIGDIFL